MFVLKKLKFKKRIKGVNILSPQNTFIEQGVEIGEGTVIYPNNYIKSGVKIGKNCILYPGNFLESGIIGNNCSIGNNAHFRQKVVVGNNVKIGNFCELKCCFVQDNCKISHLTYIGDAEIGQNCNLGCGVVFANFNGTIKQKITIGNDCFIGCNSNLIAPLSIVNNCFIAGGSTITKDMQNNTFAISRTQQNCKDNKFCKHKSS